jgi:two-component system, chemotaxis family, chemotaxis protein CheY
MEEPRQRRHSAAKRTEGAVEAEGAEGAALPAPPERSGRRALVVEADPGTLRLCRDALESSGFVVDAVDSGIAAVVVARKRFPDLIFMDLQLRDVPGREAIGWLRSNPALRSTPIIILTTNAEDDSVLAATRPGASLRKPVSPAAIRRAIRELLR